MEKKLNGNSLTKQTKVAVAAASTAALLARKSSIRALAIAENSIARIQCKPQQTDREVELRIIHKLDSKNIHFETFPSFKIFENQETGKVLHRHPQDEGTNFSATHDGSTLNKDEDLRYQLQLYDRDQNRRNRKYIDTKYNDQNRINRRKYIDTKYKTKQTPKQRPNTAPQKNVFSRRKQRMLAMVPVKIKDRPTSSSPFKQRIRNETHEIHGIITNFCFQRHKNKCRTPTDRFFKKTARVYKARLPRNTVHQLRHNPNPSRTKQKKKNNQKNQKMVIMEDDPLLGRFKNSTIVSTDISKSSLIQRNPRTKLSPGDLSDFNSVQFNTFVKKKSLRLNEKKKNDVLKKYKNSYQTLPTENRKMVIKGTVWYSSRERHTGRIFHYNRQGLRKWTLPNPNDPNPHPHDDSEMYRPKEQRNISHLVRIM